MFGTAYQVYDDCLDVFGSEAVAGKSLGTDLAKGKLTLPVLLLLERADASDRARVEALVRAWQPASIKPMGKLLAKYDTLDASLSKMRQYLDRSRRLLTVLPISEGRAGLSGLAESLAGEATKLGAAPESSL